MWRACAQVWEGGVHVHGVVHLCVHVHVYTHHAEGRMHQHGDAWILDAAVAGASLGEGGCSHASQDTGAHFDAPENGNRVRIREDVVNVVRR